MEETKRGKVSIKIRVRIIAHKDKHQ